MKFFKLLMTLLLAAAAVAASVPALAHGDHHHGRARVGVFIGAPLWPAWYYPPPYYYSPPVVAVPAPQPPVYVEQGPAPSSTQNYWYYCNSPEGYYPYVKDCPGGWLKVLPQPSQP